MVFATGLAIRRGFPADDAGRLVRLIERLDAPPLPAVAADDLLALMARDKKARESGIAWVLPQRLGAGEIATDLDLGWVETELRRFLEDPVRFCPETVRRIGTPL
jgi:3-dehydroquinate synthetase